MVWRRSARGASRPQGLAPSCCTRKDRDRGRDLLEFKQRRVPVHGDMRACTGRALQVGLQDGRAPGGGHFFQADLLTMTVVQDCFPAGGPDVADPGCALAQHRYQIPLTIQDRHHQGKRYRPAGAPARHFQRDEVIACNATRKDDGGNSVHNARQQIGPSATVHPACEVARHVRMLRSRRHGGIQTRAISLT